MNLAVNSAFPRLWVDAWFGRLCAWPLEYLKNPFLEWMIDHRHSIILFVIRQTCTYLLPQINMIVDASRLIFPSYDMARYFPGFTWRTGYDINVPDEGIVMADPINLADVYNSSEPVADYLRLHALFVVDFGGDASGDLWFDDPFVVMPISLYSRDAQFDPGDASLVVNGIGCDSGSFAFLPYRGLPSDVNRAVDDAMESGDAQLIHLPVGDWSLRFEQFPAPNANMTELYRNIVLQREIL